MANAEIALELLVRESVTDISYHPLIGQRQSFREETFLKVFRKYSKNLFMFIRRLAISNR